MKSPSPDFMRYVVGFTFDQAKTNVALIRKKRPSWQKFLLNGMGGKIESNETPLQAMVREFGAKTGCLKTTHFRHYALIKSSVFSIDCFFAFGDLNKLRTITDETVEIVGLNEIEILRSHMVKNLPELIALAIDQWDNQNPLVKTIHT